MTFTALIVDDEPLARESLRLLLSKHDDVVIAGEASNGRDALAMIRRRTPDVLFLDVQMPGMGGLDLLRTLGACGSLAVVFVTAYDRYAIQAFESRALDYLLKPYTDERFEQVLSRAKEHIRSRTLTELGAKVLDMLAVDEVARPFMGRDSVIIKDGRRAVRVPAGEIDWIEATDYYAGVYAAGRSYLVRESLKSLADTLDPDVFVRAHRSALVNVERVRAIEKGASGDAVAVLDNGQRVRVSRSSPLLSHHSLHRSSPR